MGYYPPRVTYLSEMLKIILLLFISIAPLFISAVAQESVMTKSAMNYIDAFQRGETFSKPIEGLVKNGQLELDTVKVFKDSLASASNEVRENIVRLLVALGTQINPQSAEGFYDIRQIQIIALLVGPALSKDDAAFDVAMEALRKRVSPPLLAQFGDSILKTLEMHPSGSAFLLVAKAKPKGGEKLVGELSILPKWQSYEAVKIARAALGDELLEDKYIDAVKMVNDGVELNEALWSLALIGTNKSLKAIAEQLRTPLTIDRPGAYENSVRLDVLDALIYNFPGQPVLSASRIVADEDYQAAEDFCTKTLGVVYTEPRPPFMTVRPYPIPLPP